MHESEFCLSSLHVVDNYFAVVVFVFVGVPHALVIGVVPGIAMVDQRGVKWMYA
jgi:hypothetical protein